MLLFISIAAVSAVSEEQLTDNVTVSNQNNVVLGAAIDDMNISSSGENSFLGAPDSGDSVLGAQDAGTLANLRTKINNAPSDSEIFLENDYNFGSYSSGAGVQISKNLVIDGQGYTIDANEMGRIFYIPSIGSASKIGYNVTLKNIVFKNAKYAAAAGGAIYFGGYNLTVENCTFESNKNTFASKGGGAIYVAYRENVLVNITDTTFTKNSVQHGGGALYFDNPNNLQTDFNIYINNSDFIENSAGPSGYGGGAIINYRGANLYIDSSRFVANTANGKDGGAIRYSGTTTITNSEFYENKAEYGAAIGFGQFVDLTIKGSIFANNTAVQEGGAVKARYFTIDDVDFINNTAARGGALYSRSNVATLQNSRFTNNTASIYGGALYVNEEVNSLSVSNNDFIDNNANEGGAVYSNSKSVTTTNSNFYNNSANSGGAIYINKGEFTISGSTLENNTATIEGGAVDVRSSDGVEIKGSLLKNNSAPLGGAVYWYGNNGKIIESHFVSNNATNGSSVNWRGSSGSIEKSTFNDSNINFGSVFWHGPDGSISESTFLTPKAVYICSYGDVHFKDNTELSPESGDYIIYVANKASFDSNDFNNLIYNYGLIISPTYIVTLDNTTKISNSNSVVVYTQVLDDNNNIIELGDNIVNVYDSTNLPTTYNGTHYVSSINNLKIGEHRISSIGYNASRFTDLTVKTGGVLYLVLNLTINQTNFGEKVVINATLVNTTYNGTMDIALNDIHYNVTLTNGTAILTLYNLAPNTYDIVATYQEFNQTISTDVIISVELRNSTINITANNVYYGNITTIKVNVTNGTTGFVYLFVNNKMYTIQLVNSTGEYNLTGLAGGNYTVFGLYAGDAYFESSYNQTSFNVYKYDTPINITVKDINVGQIATIKVDFPSDINGRAYVFIEDREYVFYNRTSVTIYESNLTAGNITVRAYHDGNNKYKENTTVAYFNVTKKNMTIIVRTADVPVGENETILVVIPADAKGVVLLTVNGTNYFQYADGNLARFVISGLARGLYNVTATYAEGPIYNTANASSSFNVFYVRAFDFNVSTSVDNDLNVLVDISLPKDIDGDVYVEINGTNYTAHMSKGKGTVLIAGLSGGEYNGTVYLVNDTKYLSSNRTFTVNLERVSPNIVVDYNHTIYVDDDAIIKVTIDNDAAGNITIRINNTNYTQKIENGVANFNITGLAWNTYQFNVTYAGDRKYLPDVKEYTLEVSRIHNYYSYLEIHDIYVGENATVKVTFEDDTTGTVTLLINGSTHVIHLTNGTGTINITGLPVGKHIINATYSGDRKYEPCNRVFEDFHVKKIINYDFIPKGNTSDTHADINVTLPSDASGHVNITINGVTYTNIPVTNGFANYTVYNLESGKQYPTRIDYSGNEKYEAASRNITLNSQKTLDYEFIVEGDSIHVGDVAHIIVKLPKATDGDRVVIRVENVTNPYNTFVVNGTINQSVINLKEGEYHVTVEYEGNSEFEASAKSTYIYVSKISSFRFDVIANEPYVGENLTVDIILPDDTKGNVTVTVSINNTNYTANVTNGTAHVEIPNLPAGVYNTTVFYSGDNKYHNATKTIEVIVQKIDVYEFTVTPSDIFVGENETIRIKLPKDIDGDVTITIVNTTHVNRAVNVVNGTGWYNVTGLARGQYVAYVTLKNDSKYEEDTVFGNFKVSPIADYLFNVTVSDPNYVRDNITFNIELPENATGNVSVIIFGNEYLGKIKDGNATVNITAPYYGTFPYRVSFEEEGKYSLKTQTGSVVISKLSVDLNPDYPTPVYVGENVTFKVQLPKDATGNITVITRMATYTVKLVNGSANVTVPAYPLAQNYSPSISYSGDDRYFANTTTLNLVVIKVSDYNLTVNVSDIHVGQTEIVNITLPSDATDDVLIYGNFSTDRFSKEIIKGKVSFDIANLKAGTYNITVLYQGYNKYESKNVTKTFTVGKVNSTIAIELVNGSKIVVSVPDNAVGEVEISIDTIKENVTIQNGKAILDVSNVDPGEYLVNASFAGDENYFGNKTSKTVVIPKITDYLINVTVEDIIVGENATVIVRLPGDINGFANITVNNVPYNNVEVKNGIAKLNVTKLAVGKYDASVNFTNSKYAFKTNSTEFEVFKIKTVLSTSISVENQTATITVRITENATGNITVYIDSKPYQRVIENNQVQVTVDLMPGDHIVQSHYDGDTNHSSADTSLYVIEIEKIKDYDLKINLTELITVIENNTITVTFPEKAYGRITIYVNEDFYNAEINTTTHNATVTLPYLKEGVYNVSVSYSNELYDYMSNRSSFRVIKLNTTIDVDVENITKDLTEVINITLNENVTGDVLIDVNGTVYHRTLENGKVNLTLTNLNDGKYTVIVTYEGSDFFNVNSTSVNFTVSKIPVEITVNASDIVVGHVLNIKFNMSREITDLVTVQVGKTNYTSFVYKGNGSLDVYDLPIGDYDITVYYAGDKDYLASSNKTSISVTGKKSSKMNVTVADITVGDDISVYINTTEPINGPVYVTIAGLAYTRELVNGEVTFKVSNLTARDYTISAFFMGDDDYELCNATSNFTVHKKNTNIVLDVDDINIGQYEIVNVTVNENATGYVLISIGTIHVYANITDGVASAVIRNLAIGKYNVTVEYIGDDNFNGNSTKGSFVVSQLKTNITIDGYNIYVGQNVTFDIATSANITEVVIVNVAKTGDAAGQNYTTFIENGKGNYTVYDLAAGDYTVTVFFPGNTQYAAVNNTTTIKVYAKKASQVTVEVDNITVGEDAVIFVNVTDGATGSVTIIVAGDYYTKELNNSKANFTISGLSARDYHVSAVYLGDDYYLMGEGTANFTVNKKDTEIDFEVADIDIGQYEIINVTVNKNATGYVLISIGTIHVYANITDGAASAVIRNLAVGKYNVTVMYMGDDYFNTNSTNKSFTVSQLKTDITINGTDIYVGQSVTFNVTTSANITEVVIINVAKVSDAVGQNYTTFIENGKGNYTVYDLPEGEYIVTVYFPGNTQYAAVNNTTTIKVNAKKVSEVTVKVDDITVDEDAVIFVNVTDGATGTVTIIVAGDYYTKELNNSKANFTISGLIARDYHVSAVYLGDDYYLMGEGTANFTVHKKVTSINATAKDINVSEIETIKVNVTQGATGVVLIDINGTKYYANLTDSKVSLDISNLAVGRYDVTVTYLGDDKFHSNETKATFTVSKLDPEISISLHKILFAHGEDVIVYLTGPSDVTGVVTVTVGNIYGNDTHTAYINNGAGTLIIKNLDVDSYNVSAFYHENYKYIGKNTTKIAFEVYHNGTNISVTAHNIHVGQKETIMVTFPEGKFEGNVTIYVDGNPHNATIVYNATTNMSKAILTLDEDYAAGTYDVQVTYVHETEGKKVLYEGSNEFTVSKIESIIKINPIADIKFGENTTVVMKLNHDDATGEIHVYVDGKLHVVDATNPVLELDNLRRDYYYIQAFYMGDDKYLPSEAEVEFNVTKATPSMNIIIANDTYDVGSDVEINVTINKTATGYINLIVDGAENLLEINNGIVSYTLVNATPGNHTIVAEYLGDNNYYKASAERNFTVGKYTPVVNIADISIDEDTHEINVTVKVNDDATGTIFIILENGTTVGSGIIDKGVAVITLDRILDPDTYNIVANYTGDDNYMNMTASASFTVPDITNYVLPVSANNITYGEGVVTVIVILPDGAKRENLTVKVDGVVYNNYVVDGNAVKVTLPSLKAGDHVVDVTYADDGYYATKSNSTVFNIAKATSDVILEVNSIYYVDDDIVINVTRFNSTGAITVKINGKNYNLTGNNVSIPKGLPNGTYIVDVILDGDENFTGAAKNATFAVNKLTPNVTVINVDRIIVGNDAVIKIVGSDDRDANLVVNVGGIDYAVNLTKGSAALTVKGLDIGNNSVTVTYLENDKYVETGANGWVNVVDKASSAVVIKVNDNYDVDDTVEITVKAVNSTGNLVVTINGKVYTPKDDKITIDKAVYGTYDIVAVLDGDDNYYGSSNNATFKVNKITKNISANNVTITVGEDAVITVKGPQDRTGQIIVEVGGEKYLKEMKDGVSEVTIKKLDAGEYPVGITYLENDKYLSTGTNASITVNSKADSSPLMNVTVDVPANSTNGTVTVELPENATGNVTVIIDGKEYTVTDLINGSAVIPIDNILPGNHTVEVIYSGDGNYT
uniref:Ig-like domain repeat protein n=1 Tax=Methanobrevibacter sp. TaxID=66852 RepID=UPI00388F1083